MESLIMAAQLILSLAILVTLHELGHFIAARAFGIKVEKFYLFFDAWGVKLFSFKYKDTEYGIGWLPLGGYVKIAGMVDESMDKDQIAKPAEPWEFRSKPAWQRLIVMIGGVTVNLLLGIFIFSMMIFKYGENYVPASELKYGIIAQELGKEIGLETGDKIISINGKPLEKFEDLTNPDVFLNKNVQFEVDRNGEQKIVKIPADFIEKLSDKRKAGFVDFRYTFKVGIIQNPLTEKAGLRKGDVFYSVNGDTTPYFDMFHKSLLKYKNTDATFHVYRDNQIITLVIPISEDGKLGFKQEPQINFGKNTYGFFESFSAGTERAFYALAANIKGFGKVIKGEVNPSKALAGPIGIAKEFGSTWVWERFWALTALISLILAFMNILPIPALDGGHVVLLLLEMVMGRPLSEKTQMTIQSIGMIILLALMVFVFGNDIYKLLASKF